MPRHAMTSGMTPSLLLLWSPRSASLSAFCTSKRCFQIHHRQQFFACYDTHTHFLYINDLTRRKTLKDYLSYALQKEFEINNVYASVDEFCNHIKSIRGFRYTQVRNLFSQNGDIFNQVSDLWGLDTPERIQMKITYSNQCCLSSRYGLSSNTGNARSMAVRYILACDYTKSLIRIVVRSICCQCFFHLPDTYLFDKLYDKICIS